MDNKDGRRSRVPAGTFGGSNPPPAPEDWTDAAVAEGDTEEPTQPGIRRSNRTPPPVPGEARKRYVSTLVGHPSSGSPAARAYGTPPPAPMLAPPKWTGAAPYLQGEEPQPQVSALPAPQHVPLAPVSLAEPARSRITTKVGHVHAPPPPPVAANAGRALPAIGDAIQEMLDAQASVPIEVDDTRAEARMREFAAESPIDELQIEEILEGLSEPPPPMATESPSSRDRGDESTLIHAAPPPPQAPPPPPEVAPLLLLPVQLTALDAGGDADTLRPPATVLAQPASDADPWRPEPAPAPRAEPMRARRAAAEIGMHGDPSAASLAPAEVSRAPRYHDDSQAGLGVLLLAAMAVIGVGGWLLTQGGYPGARPAPVPAQLSAAVSAQPPAAPPATPTSAPALPAATTPPSDPPRSVASETSAANDDHAIKRPPSKLRLGAKSNDGSAPPAPKEELASAQAPSEVLTVAPREESATPQLPSRDDVLAALAPIRAAVAECAHGQRGVAQLDITVANTGFVTHAVVGGDFAGTSEGSCIALTARSARFVPFQKPRFRVIYPFSL